MPFHKQECFQPFVRPGDAFPVADRAAATSLALPIYSELPLEQQRNVVSSIATFINSAQ